MVFRAFARLQAMRGKMPCAGCDVADFIVKDSRKDRSTACIALCLYPLEHGGCDVQPPCFQSHRNHCESGADIMGGSLSRLPQPCMRRERAVPAAHRSQLSCKQGEMHRFIGRYCQEIPHEIRPHVPAEPPGHVEGKVDRHEFYVGQGMP